MEESIFEVMERTGFVDRAFSWLAILGPFLVATLLFAFRNRPFVALYRHHWVLVFISGPLVLLMWKIYNKILDHYGVDSVFGMFINALLFLGVGVALSFLDVYLDRTLNKPVAQEAPADV